MRKPRFRSDKFSKFMASDTGAQARYAQRLKHRVSIPIDEIEPQSKKMRPADCDRFQNAVAEHLTMMKRGTFKGDIALKLDLGTTSPNAPQAHTIAKNFLDLLGKRRPGVKWPKRSLLYDDDSQIQALSVSCRHGEDRPRICVEARPLSSMLDDLELGAEAVHHEERDDPGAYYTKERDDEWIETFADIIRDEARNRRELGDEMYEAYFKMTRWSAQQAVLGRSGVDIPVLNWLYERPKAIPTGLNSEMWADLLLKSKRRLHVGDLPISEGGSAAFKAGVAAEIARFKQDWDWVLNPLVIAVALEVVVRPNPNTPVGVLHDLDNIVRDYLLPGIVPAFGTVTDHRWTIDFEELNRRDPEMAARWGPNPTPPRGTKSGVTRYEAWRLPPVPGKAGFVSVALVADMDVQGDTMQRLDERIKRWAIERARKEEDRRRFR
ncbi:hypothetical protein ABAC460_20195 [Asticcacaulis sp. AC460]|uniref:hypothetical protein n=1 Tax=Asticcacaulis sp. AC460 TaxID=1282360 RepID=UPI0003C3ABF6|nr:hypothetical protein [Asticcacaulis sp. AC460]ESQ87347.1 hypothetical protein ABAC460_20195 [Asticcacaulis sp. AC460]